MALIGKIRQNFWLVLIVLGLALASFILMDVMGSNSGGGLFNQTTIGEVNGEKIEYQEFTRVENALFSGNTDASTRRATVWNYLVEKNLVDNSASALGLGVSRDELMDLQFGANLSPIIQNNFRNPQTGQVDRQQLLQIKQAIEGGQELGPQFRDYWANQEVQIMNEATKDKINTLVAKGMYTPKWLAEVTNSMNTETATFEFVKVGFDKVSDSEVSLTDADYQAYIDNNVAKYTNEEETRLMDYVVFDVLPTAKDSSDIKNNVGELMVKFKATENDSLFAFNNGGGYSSVYAKVGDMQGIIAEQIVNLEAGELYGPYLENGFYQAFKVVNKDIIPDSVEARHILRTVENGDINQLASANAYADSLMNLYTSGVESFDSLAVNNSQDPGTSFKGGDLGTFAQGLMVPAFNKACFVGSKKGGLYKVNTSFGVHIIEVRDLIYDSRDPKYQIAVIGSPIIPSEETQNGIDDKAAELMRNNRTLEALTKAVEESSNLVLSNSKALKLNDFIFGDLGSDQESRDIIKWAFTAAPGEVAPTVYEYKDQVNYFSKNFVVVGLKSIQPPGKMTVAEAKTTIQNLVLNSKKGEVLSSKINGSELSSIAAQFGTVVDTAKNVSFNSGFIPNNGSEPIVVGKLFTANQGDVVGPITGETGVYIGRMISKTPSIAASNIPQLKKSLNSGNRSQVTYRLWEAFKKMVSTTDNRSNFF